MKFLIPFFFVTIILIQTSKAEFNQNQMDDQFLRMMQQKAEQAQKEDEYKSPKKATIGKDRAVLGNRNAPITLVAYSDFQCPYCKKGYLTAEEVRNKYKGKILFIFKNLPLPFHAMAMPAAKMFEAIGLQNAKKAYEFHNAVFTEQEKLAQGGVAFLEGIAKNLKIDMDKMKKDMESDVVKKHIDDDMAEAKLFGISGTPGFLVMGITIKGAYPASEFYTIIDKRLKGGKK